MAGLFDFGKVANLALSMDNLEETRRRNDIAQTNSESEQGRLDVMRQRLEVDQRQADQQHFAQLLKFSDDPMVRGNPDLQNQVYQQMGKISGMPAFEDPQTLNYGRQQFKKVLQAMNSGDPQMAQEGLGELFMFASPEDASKIVGSMDKFQGMQQNAENLRLTRELKQAQVEKLQANASRLNAGQIPYTTSSQDFMRALDGTEKPGFAQAMKFADSFKAKGANVNKNIAALYSKDGDVSRFAGKEISQIGEMANAKASKYLDVANQSQEALDLLERGGELPQGVTKADLRNRVVVGRQVSEAYSTLAEWANDPFDATKLKAARSASKLMESQRKSMESLSASNQADAIDLRRQALDIKSSVEYQKYQQQQGETNAQNEFLDWKAKHPNLSMDHPETQQQVADIAKAYNTPAENVWKAVREPKKALVENNVNMTQEKAESKKVGEGFGDQFMDIMKADVKAQGKLARLDRMQELSKGFETGGLVPTLTKIQNVAASLGFQVDPSLGAKQAFEALGSEIALTLRNPEGGAGMPGALSDKDREFLTGMTPDLAKTPEGNRLIIETGRKLAKRDMEVAKMARAYRKKHGQMDEGFYDELAAYSEKNQMFAGKSLPQSGPAQPVAPSNDRVSSYGNRQDGTPKGAGYFGEIPNPGKPGSYSTELSIGVNLGGKEHEIPLLVPTLTPNEVQKALAGQQTDAMVDKAVAHAKQRMKSGKSPFAQPGEKITPFKNDYIETRPTKDGRLLGKKPDGTIVEIK